MVAEGEGDIFFSNVATCKVLSPYALINSSHSCYTSWKEERGGGERQEKVMGDIKCIAYI